MFQQILDRVSENPQAWNVLRRVVEDNFRGEKAAIARELAPFDNVGQREFLDVGCGTGEFAPCFPSSHYTGIDLSRAYLGYAVRAYAGRFVALNVAALPFAPARFDAALVLGVIHHLPDDVARQALAELHRVLKPGAVALVMEDIPPPDLWNVAGHAMHWLDRGGNIRSDADYRALFGGFAIERSYTMRSGICDYGVYVLRRDQRTTIDQ
ncbi:MAG: class I SAM-dependent methyltransferase [Chloroflexales bacterium]|nr:class I SAM-dependent methyltransferase [Chloroflexales bacterium]